MGSNLCKAGIRTTVYLQAEFSTSLLLLFHYSILSLFLQCMIRLQSNMPRIIPGHILQFTGKLLSDVSNNTSTNGAATLADSEVLTLVHSDWSKQLNLEGYLIARHNHFFVSW